MFKGGLIDPVRTIQSSFPPLRHLARPSQVKHGIQAFEVLNCLVQKELNGFPADFFLHNTEPLANSVPTAVARQFQVQADLHFTDCSIFDRIAMSVLIEVIRTRYQQIHWNLHCPLRWTEECNHRLKLRLLFRPREQATFDLQIIRKTTS